MSIQFYKYQGTGNDFVMIDDRKNELNLSNSIIQSICNRRFGIGADGIILIRNHQDYDFEMIYYNSDGSQSFCGNGSRCALAFAEFLGIFKNEASFLAIDGAHIGQSIDDNFATKMKDVDEVEVGEDYIFIDTGSPHYIIWSDNVDEIDIKEEAHKVRYNSRFKAEGTNVNFVEDKKDAVKVRTYERGVEDETFSCGTGVTAVCLANAIKKEISSGELNLEVKGGKLKVAFQRDENQNFKEIWLIGPAKFVFDGKIDISKS